MQSWSGYFFLLGGEGGEPYVATRGEENHLHLPFTCILTPTDTGLWRVRGPEDKEWTNWGEELFIKPEDTGFQKEEEKG